MSNSPDTEYLIKISTPYVIYLHLCVSLWILSMTHSAEPIMPASSAAQLPKMMLLLGLQPDFIFCPRTLAISITGAVPLEGSMAPYPQASLWLPTITYLINQLLIHRVFNESIWVPIRLLTSQHQSYNIFIFLIPKIIVDHKSNGPSLMLIIKPGTKSVLNSRYSSLPVFRNQSSAHHWQKLFCITITYWLWRNLW